ncbi:hypothetical protein DRP53_08735 [candidate division WOR-3 bacterium]|uniref:Bacterial Pleckstrin homology domain-containing protein n=1 Tax=candidate division WOR-3 bacterium TaxID=2052148 RepID=A0A660SH13_UNCW3|nr:MAG: hypothetical protein DRP53_08735 [candidate division WOR-3 bacterium]
MGYRPSDEKVIYRERIPLGRSHRLLLSFLIMASAAFFIIFTLANIPLGMLVAAFVLLVLLIVYRSFQKAMLILTKDELLIRSLLPPLRIRVEEISSIEVRDKLVLPEPYQGHIRVGGVFYRSWPDLKILKYRKNGYLYIGKQNGESIILTPKHPNRLEDLLKKLKQSYSG